MSPLFQKKFSPVFLSVYFFLFCFSNFLPLAAAEPIHPAIGISTASSDGAISLTLAAKKQNYDERGEYQESAINSPKSIIIHPNGQKYYVNSLEAGLTAVFSTTTNEKLGEISHYLDASHDALWASPSGFYEFTHYPRNDHFLGKPVEAAFTHGGRYLWIPYYRRLYDVNAQDPSAVAVIDTAADKIIRLFETGPLPKMIAASPMGNYLAVTCWGDNTVGLIDISSSLPEQWAYKEKFVIDYKVPLNYSLDEPVNRDQDSGHSLRGTVFTPDGQYLLVSAMAAIDGGGIAVIDLKEKKYLGRVVGMMPNIRHLAIKNDWLYLSINRAGYIQRTPLAAFLQNAAPLREKDGHGRREVYYDTWETCKVGSGARTIVFSPKGRYIFAACWYESAIYVADSQTMQVVCAIAADSFPVGLAISDDGQTLYSTSQGYVLGEGDAVDIYHVKILSE